MSYQRVRRRRRRKNGNVLAVILVILAVALASLIGAAIWQKLDQKDEPQQAPSSSAAEPSSSAEPEQPSEESPESPDEEDPEQQPEEESSSQQDPTVVTSPFENLADVVVPKGDWVDSEYFDDAMFVGDSITYGMQVYNTMTNATIIAHTGINPQTILSKAVIQQDGETLTVLEAMGRHDPGKIYIMLGANGVAFLEEADMMNFYGQFIESVPKQHPDALVYVQSILPVTAEKSQDERYSNDRIDQYNISLMNLCKEKGVHYLNVAEAFKDEDGNLPSEASPKDGMHFGSTYYMKWFDYLKCHAVSAD